MNINKTEIYFNVIIILIVLIIMTYIMEIKTKDTPTETKSSVVSVTSVDCYKVYDYYEVIIRDTYGNDWVYEADSYVPDGTEMNALFTSGRVVQVLDK